MFLIKFLISLSVIFSITSNIKPFIYSAAIANGINPSHLINDAPIIFEDDNIFQLPIALLDNKYKLSSSLVDDLELIFLATEEL